MLFFGEWLLLIAVWALAALIVEADARVLQHAGAALMHAAAASLGVGMLLGDALSGIEPAWQRVTATEAACAIASFLAGLLIARLAYSVDGRQAASMALTAAVGYVVIDLFLHWAVSTK